jgi:hypothetical protein
VTRHRVVIVNHCAIDIACPPSHLWAALTVDYADGGGFARAGYQIEPLDEPALVLGGYRMRFESEALVDERICRITERDEDVMRLSLQADYLSAEANGMVVYASYQALPDGEGALYRLDCHTTLDLEAGVSASREELARSITRLRDHFQDGIAGKAAELKARLEATKVG